MIGGLPKDLIEARNELTALKTAHRHGLGSIAFFKYHTDLPKTGSSYTQYGTLTLTVAADMPFPPIVELLSLSEADPTVIMNGVGGYNVSVDQANRKLIYSLRFYKSGTGSLPIAILSSARIASIEFVGA